jgi:hypothetical protein
MAFVIVCVLGTLAVASFAQPQLGSLLEKLALTAAGKRLNPYLEANQPVVRDWDTIFPQVDALPGPAFRPTGIPEAVASSSLAASGFRTISLPPGDYAVPLQLYCMHFSGGSGPGLTYKLGPFRGTRAEMISTLIGRGSAQHISHEKVQVLAWGLQAGLPYERLDPGSRALFDQLLPEYRGALGPGFLEGVQQFWQTMARTIPGLPPFNAAVGKLGPASILLQDYQNSQRTMQQFAGDYQQLSQQLFLHQQGTHSSIRPWSVVAPGVYERMIGDSGAMGPGSLQIRVQPTASRARMRNDHSVFTAAFFPGPDQIGRDETVAAPVGNVMGYPNLQNGQTPLGGLMTTQSDGDLTVQSVTTEAPSSSITVWLTKSKPTVFPAHTIGTDSTETCTAGLNFNNQDSSNSQDVNHNDPIEGVPFVLNVTVLNNSSQNLNPPTMNVVGVTPALDALKKRPQLSPLTLLTPSQIPSGQQVILKYKVTATWNTFSQPGSGRQFAEQLGATAADKAADILGKLGKINSATAGTISNAASVAPDLVDLLQTHFTISVNYQLSLSGQGYSISYAKLPGGTMNALVIAPPQELAAASVYIPKKFAALGTDVVPVVGSLGSLLASWVTQSAVCRDVGQSSNACAMASAHWDDDWYTQVLSGGNITCQSTDGSLQCGQQSGCQSILPAGGSPLSTPALQVPPSSASPTVTVGASPTTAVAGARCTISGVARDAAGTPIASATVQLTISAGGATIPMSATTGSDGSYAATFTAPPAAGTVSIAATIAGSSSAASATAKTTITVIASRQ